MISTEDKITLNDLRTSLQELNWFQVFVPQKILHSINSLPNSPLDFKEKHVIAIVKAYQNSNWLMRTLFQCLRIFKNSALFKKYENVDQRNTKAYVNFYWTGKIPHDKQLQNILDWKKSCKNSDFDANLFLTADIIKSLLDQNKLTPVGKDQYILHPHRIFITDFDALLSSYKHTYPDLMEIYTQHIQHQNYAFASDIARLIILNDYPGFYVDMDTRPGQNLPASIDELIKDIDVKSYNDYYLNIIKVPNGAIIENQIILSLKQGNMLKLLSASNDEYAKIKTLFYGQLNRFDTFKKNPRVLALGNSFFQSGSDSSYLEAFLDNNADAYHRLNYAEGIYAVETYPYLVSVYTKTMDLFLENISQNVSQDYKSWYPDKIGIYFKSDQNELPLYNWGNPGYARLMKLKTVANKIESAVLSSFDSKGRMHVDKEKVKLKDYIAVLRKLSSFLEDHEPSHHLEAKQTIEEMIGKFSPQAFSYYMPSNFLLPALEELKKLIIKYCQDPNRFIDTLKQDENSVSPFLK